MKTQRSGGFEVIWGKFIACKMIDFSTSSKFRAPRQILNSVFTHLSKNRLENEVVVREVNEFP